MATIELSEASSSTPKSKYEVYLSFRGYASSTWCLNELVKIIECKNTIGQIVIPIFYDIDPSDVRKQTLFQELQIYQVGIYQTLQTDNSRQPNGLASIQQQLLYDILNLKSIGIHNVDRGINLIRERLCYRRVLIVLDDVDDSTQLNSLAGDRKWFGAGSRIIVTTRNQRLLTELEVGERYKVEELNLKESLQLLSWLAFRKPDPKNGYFQLSRSVVDHVQGLPLALEILVIGVSVLLDRSLMTIDQCDHKLKMHDLLQDMGREIVRELEPNHIGKRSRLWFHHDVVDVLRKHTGTEAVECLSLDVSVREDVILSTESFAKMINLRLLKINSFLHKLKILDLSYSIYLAETPNFAGLSNLERLEFEVTISFGLLKNLERLSLAGCKDEPPSKSLFSFFSSRISPKKVSSSALLTGTFSHLSILKELYLSHRNLSDSDISIDFGSFPFLRFLYLEGNKFYSLPVGISNHPRLLSLLLNDCTNLQSIPELPLTLQHFEAQQCTSICRYPNLFNLAKIELFKITNCLETMDICYLSHPSTSRRVFGPRISIWKLASLKEVPNWFDYKEMGASVLFRVPSLSTGETRAMIVWVVYSIKDEHNGSPYDSITIHFKNKTKGNENFDKPDPDIFDTNIRQDHTWISYMIPDEFVSLKVDEGDEIEVSVEAHASTILVKKCGIHLPSSQSQEEE
ncbi:hypothetical protein CRYUN_Cryun29cG0024700 [Craigia yunnanensis]